MHDKKQLFNEIHENTMKSIEEFRGFWIEQSFLTWRWWMLLLTTIFIWILWAKIVDKKRTQLILNYGLILGIFSTILDMIGTNYGAWAYTVHLHWAFIPPLIAFDLSYLPVIFMLVYQKYGHSWTLFLIALLFTSAVISFVIEPIFEWIGIYVMYKWEYIYSFPIYILLPCFVKVFVEFINKKLQ